MTKCQTLSPKLPYTMNIEALCMKCTLWHLLLKYLLDSVELESLVFCFELW